MSTIKIKRTCLRAATSPSTRRSARFCPASCKTIRPHRHELEKIDVYCRALWAAYWRYLTADADRTLFYWSFYHSEYYTQAVAARSIPNYRTLEAFMDALDKRFHISERHDSGVLVANMIDGSINAAVRVLRGEFSGDDRTLNTVYQTVIQPLFSVLGLRI